MIFQNVFFPSLILPLLVAAVVYVVTILPFGRPGGSNQEENVDQGVRGDGRIRGAWTPGTSLALASSFLASYVAITGWPRWLPVEATQRLFFVVLAVAVVAFVLADRTGSLLRWVLGGLVFAGLLFWILQPPIHNSWSPGQSVLWLAGLTLAGLSLTWAFERSFTPASSVLTTALLAVLLALSAVLLGLSASGRLAQLLGATTSGLVAIAIVARLTRRSGPVAIDSLVLSTVVLGLLACGFFYAELAVLPAGLCLLAFVLLGMLARRTAPFKLLAVLPLVAALAIAAHGYFNQPEDPYAAYYEADSE